ncbi:MAG TPA: zf-HC2 domain-containing protein [Solirubrobacteraceae bacterium]|jgi:hypothetical protein|nr:zf-HC2 domain-containing protein [Solirubrobacteraceae bacterium]
MEPAAISCKEFVELVTEYDEGTLDVDSRARFDHHIALCDGCATYLDQVRQSASAVGRLDEEHLSEPARTHLLDAFRGWRDGGG